MDELSYIEMLRLWRFAPSGHPYFKSGTEECEAFLTRFTKLRSEMTPDELVAASKEVGWA